MLDGLEVECFKSEVYRLIRCWALDAKPGDMLTVDGLYIVRTAVKSQISSVETKVVEHKLIKV